MINQEYLKFNKEAALSDNAGYENVLLGEQVHEENSSAQRLHNLIYAKLESR